MLPVAAAAQSIAGKSAFSIPSLSSDVCNFKAEATAYKIEMLHLLVFTPIILKRRAYCEWIKLAI
jgi:hypothetical protein